jgi:hypothetical protein
MQQLQLLWQVQVAECTNPKFQGCKNAVFTAHYLLTFAYKFAINMVNERGAGR